MNSTDRNDHTQARNDLNRNFYCVQIWKIIKFWIQKCPQEKHILSRYSFFRGTLWRGIISLQTCQENNTLLKRNENVTHNKKDEGNIIGTACTSSLVFMVL